MATLIEKYGSDNVLPDLIGILASDCKFRNKLGTEAAGRFIRPLVASRSVIRLWILVNPR